MAPARLTALSTSDISALFGVRREAVTQWIRRGPDFPQADWAIPTSAGAFILGWHPDREAEIVAWVKARPGHGWRKGARRGRQ